MKNQIVILEELMALVTYIWTRYFVHLRPKKIFKLTQDECYQLIPPQFFFFTS